MEGPDEEIRPLTVGLTLHGERLDKTLSQLLPEFSRSHLQQLIDQGCVSDTSGQALSKSSLRVKAGQGITVLLRPTEESQAFHPEPMAIETVFCDDHLRVIHKPAGLVVHPAPGHWGGTLLNGLLDLDPSARTLSRAGIVHRLDMDTSGLMMVARQRPVMDALVQAIARREVKREYLALIQGAWHHSQSVSLRGAIGRDPKNRLRMAVLDPALHPAKPAVTHVEPLGSVSGYTLLLCRLETGRTHQIRVHLSHAGHPLVGDALYGGKPLATQSRQALHAWRLALQHPVTGQNCAWQSLPPQDLLDTLAVLGLSYNLNLP
ncbi:MAG: RluA family pseudouridine synthase [Alphaproteobacteria bacterium]|nr:RluA family pseudouridine synthase [Alphaproteobacteria bacterium]